jgi:hypothetical protein
MGCSSCKEKRDIKEELIKSSEFVSKGVIWFTIIWSILAIYGLVTLISKFI